jgi:hypothetical protein
MYYLKLKIMKKNFYNQRTPQLLSWGTVKRSAAAIWLAVVMLLAPAVVHAAEIEIDLADITGTGTETGYSWTAITLILSGDNNTYNLSGTLSGKGISVTGNNNIIIFEDVTIVGNTYGLSIAANMSATLQLVGVNSVSAGTTYGITLPSSVVTTPRSLTITGDGELTVTGATDGISLANYSSLNITGGDIIVNCGSSNHGINLNGYKANLDISGGDITVNAGTSSGNGINVANATSAALKKTVTISGGTVTVSYAAGDVGINVGNNNDLIITGGTIDTYNNNSGHGIALGTGATGIITGGSLMETSTHLNVILTDGTTSVGLVYTNDFAAGTVINGISGYGSNDVKVHSDGYLYFWLPYDTYNDFTVNVGGTDYVADDFTVSSSAGSATFTAKTPGGGTQVGQVTVADGDPAGWDPANDILPAGTAYSGCKFTATIGGFLVSTADRTVTIEADNNLKDYVTTPNATLAAGESTVTFTYTIKSVPDNKVGQDVSGTFKATMPSASGSGTVSGTSTTVRHTLFNPLTLSDVTYSYQPPAITFAGRVTLTVKNGAARTYFYSADGGQTWQQGTGDVTDNIVPTWRGYIFVKEANSCSYITIKLFDPSVDPDPGTGPNPVTRRLVYIPEVAGIATRPSAGRHYVESTKNFELTVIPSAIPAGKVLNVRTDRDGLTAEEDRIITANGDGSYKVIIKGIQQAVNISILIETGAAAIDGSNVWGANGQLYITSAGAGNANIYALTGSLVKSVALTAGETVATSLPAGIYVVTLSGNTYKAVVK